MCPCLPSFFAAVLYPSCASTTRPPTPRAPASHDDGRRAARYARGLADRRDGGGRARGTNGPLRGPLTLPDLRKVSGNGHGSRVRVRSGGIEGGRGRDLTKALVYGCFQSSSMGPYDDLAYHLKSIALAVACGSCASAACVWRRCWCVLQGGGGFTSGTRAFMVSSVPLFIPWIPPS